MNTETIFTTLEKRKTDIKRLLDEKTEQYKQILKDGKELLKELDEIDILLYVKPLLISHNIIKIDGENNL